MEKFTIIHVILFMLVFVKQGYFSPDSDIVVPIHQGLIRGTTFTSIRTNKTYFGFLGIPYARPPIANLRFQAPQPADSWTGIRNATEDGSICPQNDRFNVSMVAGDENCLFINVYTPKLPSEMDNSSIQVMVWIHGGGFVAGSGDRKIYGADYFIDENVILVTFNYRLGILGFLSLQNNEVPGNNGMKDQVMALRWVNQNIQSFGGDLNNITIFGESAGGASVHYHLLSPMSRGLFHRAISQSGSALDPWAFQMPEFALKLAFKMAKIFGENSTDPHKVLETLRRVPPELLVIMYKRGVDVPFFGRSVKPTVDIKADKGSVFLPDTPINLLNSGQFLRIPYITGINNEEAILFTQLLKAASFYLRPVVKVFEYVIPIYIGEKIPKVKKMATEIKDMYFDNSKPLVLQYIDVMTDIMYVNGAYCTAQKQANYTDSIYSYEFSFNGTGNVMKRNCGGSEFPGASHADEIPYIFQGEVFNVSIPCGPSPEYHTSIRLLKMWTNFARTGNPTPKEDPVLQNVTWKPVTMLHFPYLSIDTNLKLKYNLNDGHFLWWKKLYARYIPDKSPCWPFY